MRHRRARRGPDPRWSATLVASVGALVVGGSGIVAGCSDGGAGDVGSIEVAASTGAGSEDDAGPTGAAVPSVARSAATVASDAAEVARPTRLRVDDVGIDAPLDPTGVRDDGLMQIPDDGRRVGWYEYGPAPGAEAGSAVLAGHVDTKAGLGAMAAMREVEMDAEVVVDLDDGTQERYRVVGRETIEKDDLPVEDIFDREGPARLTLITCGGPWRESAASYRDNVVVVAVPVGG